FQRQRPPFRSGGGHPRLSGCGLLSSIRLIEKLKGDVLLEICRSGLRLVETDTAVRDPSRNSDINVEISCGLNWVREGRTVVLLGRGSQCEWMGFCASSSAKWGRPWCW